MQTHGACSESNPPTEPCAFGGALQVGSAAFIPYLQKYITYEVNRLRGSLRLQSIDFLHLDQYMNKVAGRPQLLKAVRSNKERTEKAMRRDLEMLQQLLVKGLDYLPPEVQEDVRAHAGWTVDQLKRGELFEVRCCLLLRGMLRCWS